MEKIITISVAAFNVEKYLEKLVQSIVNSNNIEKIELLIVDDGSKDGTAELAKTYESKYKSVIRYIGKENGGHGSTINTGLSLAKGKYFKALDGDDWLDTESLDALILSLEDECADIIITDYYHCYIDGKVERIEMCQLADGITVKLSDLIDDNLWIGYPNVVYLTKFIQDIDLRIDEHTFYADTEYTMFPIPYANSIRYYKIPLYCYRLGNEGQSVSDASRIKHFLDSEKVSLHLVTFFEEVNNQLTTEKKEYLKIGISNACVWHYLTLIKMKSISGYKEFCKYDNCVKNQSTLIYKSVKKTYVKIIRTFKYPAYRFVGFLGKILS